MTCEKFDYEVKTLKRFFEYFCQKKHKNSIRYTKVINYKEKSFVYEFTLCNECIKDVDYSIDRLLSCVHEQKPKCRRCPNPCYEKNMWKKIAKVMRYSGIHLKIDSFNKSLFP